MTKLETRRKADVLNAMERYFHGIQGVQSDAIARTLAASAMDVFFQGDSIGDSSLREHADASRELVAQCDKIRAKYGAMYALCFAEWCVALVRGEIKIIERGQ